MYQLVFYVGLIGFVFFLLLSLYYFRRNNVVKLIGDMTGHNARHTIAETRKRHAAKMANFDMNSGTDMLVVKNLSSPTGERTTDELQAGGRRTDELPAGSRRTDELAAGSRRTDELAAGGRRTDELLAGGAATDALAADEPETDILRTGEVETTVLAEEAETMLLSTPAGVAKPSTAEGSMASVLGQEMQPLPDIFEVEEESVVYVEE